MTDGIVAPNDHGVGPGWFRSLSPPARLLVINHFGINAGFYMVLPFLAVYLRDDLGYGAAVVGLVLGLRTLSQQGMFPVGGIAADRIGCRGIIIAGCSLRVVAFGSFAVDNVFGNAGALIGPLLGALLLTVDFRLVALIAGVVFAGLTMAQVFMLPSRAVQRQDRGVLGSWWEVVTNRRFVAFALAGSAYLALYNQIYLALPLEAERVTGSEASISAVFVISTVITIAGQVRITAWCRARWSVGTSMSVGLALLGGGFLPLMVTAPWIPTDAGSDSVAAAVLAATPVLIGTIVFTLGLAVTFPFIMALLPIVGSERLAGTYYGGPFSGRVAVVHDRSCPASCSRPSTASGLSVINPNCRDATRPSRTARSPASRGRDITSRLASAAVSSRLTMISTSGSRAMSSSTFGSK